ncbi:MAG: hypothetical protein ACT4P3_00210 [Betaproteobacteria bacterium]
MKVSVAEVTARCRGCGGTDFTPARPGPLGLASVLNCDGCGATATYEELLDAIGEQAMRDANRSLEDLKKKRPPRKPRR